MNAWQGLQVTRSREAVMREQQRTEGALNVMRMERVRDWEEGGQAASAAAGFARDLRINPTNVLAASRLVSALLHRSSSLSKPMRGASVFQFSPQGSRLFAFSGDRAIRIWDAGTGDPVTEPLQSNDSVYFAASDPNGIRLLSATDVSASVWDANTGRFICDLPKPTGRVYAAWLNDDQLRLLIDEDAKTNRVWQFTWNSRISYLANNPIVHRSRLVSAAFSPDGSKVATASNDNTARVWDARTGNPLTEPLHHESTVCSVRFAPDSSRVITASHDRTARVWDSGNGQTITNPLTHRNRVNMAEFSQNGLRVVTASDDRSAQAWDARSGQPIGGPLQHERAVNMAGFSPDGSRIVTASSDGTARVWDTQTGQAVSDPLEGGMAAMYAEFSPNGERIVVSYMDTEADNRLSRIWEVPTVPVPVPAWFLDWAEARVGRRVDPNGMEVAVPAEEMLRQFQLVAARTDSDFFTKIAQRIQSNPAGPTSPPVAP